MGVELTDKSLKMIRRLSKIERNYNTSSHKLFLKKLFSRDQSKSKVAVTEALAVKDHKKAVAKPVIEKPKEIEVGKLIEPVKPQFVKMPEMIPDFETVQAYKSIEKRSQPIDPLTQ